MKIYKVLACLLTGLALFGATHVRAQVPLPYGAPLSSDQAKKAMAAAEAEAKKNSWNLVIAIVDAGGNLMMMQRFDGARSARSMSLATRPTRRRHSGDRPRPSRTRSPVAASACASSTSPVTPGY